jgi:hypothetical protein
MSMSVELLISCLVCLIAGFIIARRFDVEERSEPPRPQLATSSPLRDRSYLIIPDMSEVNQFIEKADKRSHDGTVNVSVVRTIGGNLELLTDYQRRVPFTSRL